MGEASITVDSPASVEHSREKATARWRKYGTPAVVILLALAIVLTLTRNWNAWEGARVEQVTNDAFVRGDLTPLSTKVAGLVRDGEVGGYQDVRKGNTMV